MQFQLLFYAKTGMGCRQKKNASRDMRKQLRMVVK